MNFIYKQTSDIGQNTKIKHLSVSIVACAENDNLNQIYSSKSVIGKNASYVILIYT